MADDVTSPPFLPPSGRLSPTHSCLEDGSHVTGHCPASPLLQAPPSQQAGEGGNPQSPHRPLLCDMEGNRRERPEYGNQRQPQPDENSGCSSWCCVEYCSQPTLNLLKKGTFYTSAFLISEDFILLTLRQFKITFEHFIVLIIVFCKKKLCCLKCQYCFSH